MIGSEFKAWRTAFGLTQTDVANHLDVSRSTIASWEAAPSPIPTTARFAVELWNRPLRQGQPLRGPVTLNYSDGPLFIEPFGPRRAPAVLKQEPHQSNSAALARVLVLASTEGVFNPFILEEGARDLWNIVELQRVLSGEDKSAPTPSNMLRRLAQGISDDAPNYVRSGPQLPSEAEFSERTRTLRDLAAKFRKLAEKTIFEFVAEQAIYDSLLNQVRTLGVRPRHTWVNGIAQALVAARTPV